MASIVVQAYYKTLDAAIQRLQSIINEGLEDGEWMNGVKDSFIAKITYMVQPVKDGSFIHMTIVRTTE